MSPPAQPFQPWTLNTSKLHRPRVTAHLVIRPRLVEELNRGLAGALTLVCASAGYGKTTLVSAWLADMAGHMGGATPPVRAPSLPAAWVSLDEYDNDLTVFLRYCCAALRTIFPDACPLTLALLDAPAAAPLDVLIATLSSEADSLPEDCILVLDDYHVINSLEIADLLAGLARHWPRPLHLVLITRRNPPLPLVRLRAKGRLTEIRTRDLQFTPEEAAQYMTSMLGQPPSAAVVAQLADQTEGWIVGLHLAMLSLPHDPDATALANLAGTDVNIEQYLLYELLAHQPPDVMTFLLQTSLLNRFCVPLCEEIIGRSDAGRDVRACLAWLEETNFLIVPLDGQREWYRYHYLLQDLLRQRAAVVFGPDDVLDVNRRASDWFAGQGLLEEALQHALAGHDLDRAARLMEQNLCELLNREDRATLQRWLNLLPEAYRRRRPGLLMIEAWVRFLSWRLGEVPAVLQQLEALMGENGQDLSADEARLLCAQILLQRAILANASNQFASSLDSLQEAFLLLPPSWSYVRGGCMLYLGVNSQASGQGDAINETLWRRYEAASVKDDGYALRILFALCVNALQAGQLEQARQMAALMLEQAERGAKTLMIGWARYYLGLVHYQWNELDAAAQHFQAIAQQRYSLHSLTARHGLLGLLRVQLVRGETAAAVQTLNLVSRYDLDMLGYETADTLSARALIQYVQGAQLNAWRWAAAFTDPVPDQPLYWTQSAHITQAWLLLSKGTAADVQAALQIIDALYEIAERTYNTRFRIALLALRALALDAQGRDRSAQAALRQAVELAQPGGFIRVFVDLGPRMHALFTHLAGHGFAPEAVGRILAAFAAPLRTTPAGPRQPASSLVEPLTSRELDILLLLRERLSDKEIAAQLVVAPATVKRHLANLYDKLAVHKRRDAVTRAEELGILPPR